MKTEDKLTHFEKEELDQENVLLKILISLFCVIAILLLTKGFMFKRVVNSNQQQPQDQAAQQQKIKNLVISKVGMLMVLPEGDPQIIAVTDAEKVKKESASPFFQNTQTGDFVLVYQTTAILYNPRLNKIINVGPVERAQNTSVSGADTKQVKPTLEIRNGTKKQGYAGQIKTKIGDLALVKSVDTANIKTYSGNILVKKSSDLASLDFGLTPKPVVSELPAGEKPFSTDYLLILGN